MMLVIRRNGLPQNIRVYLAHVRSVGANGRDITALLATFTCCEMLGRKERGCGRCTQEKHICATDMLFQEAGILTIFATQDTYFQLVMLEVCPVVASMDVPHKVFCTCERAVDNVYVMYIGAFEEQGESNMPVRLLPSTENGQRVDMVSSSEDEGARKSGTKGGNFFGCEDGVGGSERRQQRESLQNVESASPFSGTKRFIMGRLL